MELYCTAVNGLGIWETDSGIKFQTTCEWECFAGAGASLWKILKISEGSLSHVLGYWIQPNTLGGMQMGI